MRDPFGLIIVSLSYESEHWAKLGGAQELTNTGSGVRNGYYGDFSSSKVWF